jgi:hypothetical protein
MDFMAFERLLRLLLQLINLLHLLHCPPRLLYHTPPALHYGAALQISYLHTLNPAVDLLYATTQWPMAIIQPTHPD